MMWCPLICSYFDSSNFILLYCTKCLVKNWPDNPGDIRDMGSIPGSRSSPGGGHSNPFQYSCLENPVDRETGRHCPWGHKDSDTTE